MKTALIQMYHYQMVESCKRSVNRIEYFIHHLQRAKKEADVIKLYLCILIELLEAVESIYSYREKAFKLITIP